MPLSFNHITRTIYIPKDYLTPLGGNRYELDTNQFRLDLIDYMDSEEAIALPDPIKHNTEVTLAGVTFARTIEFINGWKITFEDDIYSVSLTASNNNIADVMVVNQVSLRSNNSAGLIVNYVSGTDPDSLADAVMLRQYEGSLSLQAMVRLVASMLFGKVTGAATDTVTFRDLADSKNRVIITVDNDGNRSAVQIDPT